MDKFTILHSPVAPLLEDDVNTGMIGGGNGGADLKNRFFERRRRLEDGTVDEAFVFNRPEFQTAQVMAVGSNYGCGSSSEGAVWSPYAFGIRCIVARGFADIYRENCLKNGILPVTLSPEDQQRFESAVVKSDGASTFTVDLEQQTLSGEGQEWHFDIAPGERRALLEGLDDIGQTLLYDDQYAEFEKRSAAERPFLAHATSH